MLKKARLGLILAAIILFPYCFCNFCWAEELIQAPAIMHISSIASDGKLTISEIIAVARQKGVKVIIFADHDLIRWEYGIWPLRKIIKKTVEKNSVFTYGIKRYLKEIKKAQEQNPDIILIPGVESEPFYYWQGSPFRHTLKLSGWHRHILTVGLENPQDYRSLPLVANRDNFYREFKILLLWPLVLIFFAGLCLKKKEFDYTDLQGRRLGPYSRKWQVCGIILIIFSAVFLYNNFPFMELRYDQYHGEPGIGPYQDFIDYVDRKGGLTFWAHPEAVYEKKIGEVEVATGEYSYNLLEANNYTGYAVFSEGYKKIGCPAGIWDTTLKQYCAGKRSRPVWAVGELDFDLDGELSDYINGLRTVLLVNRLDKQGVLAALKNGRVYVVSGAGGAELILDRFTVSDGPQLFEAGMGQEIKVNTNARIKISGRLLGKSMEQEPVKINLIRDGGIIETFEVKSPFNINYIDRYRVNGKKVYYRIEAQSRGRKMITNPVFVKFEFL